MGYIAAEDTLAFLRLTIESSEREANVCDSSMVRNMHVQAAVLRGEDEDEEDDGKEEEGNAGGSNLDIAFSTAFLL